MMKKQKKREILGKQRKKKALTKEIMKMKVASKAKTKKGGLTQRKPFSHTKMSSLHLQAIILT